MTDLLSEPPEVKASLVPAIERAYNYWVRMEGPDVDKSNLPDNVQIEWARFVVRRNLSTWAREPETVETIVHGTRMTLSEAENETVWQGVPVEESVLNAAIAELSFDDGASDDPEVRERLLGDMTEGQDLDVIFNLARLVLDAPLGNGNASEHSHH